jgi:hypothetical protein
VSHPCVAGCANALDAPPPQDAKQAAAASLAASQAARQLWNSQHPETMRDQHAAATAEHLTGGTLGVEKQLMHSMSVSELK